MLSQRKVEKRVVEELARDERWRIIVRGNNWLCPYCLQIGARELRMDEAIEEKIATHLLNSCQRWGYFKAEPQAIERLRQTARYMVFKGRVVKWLAEDRRYRLTDNELRWLCPFCAEFTEVKAPSAQVDLAVVGEHPEESLFVGAVVGHLLRCHAFGEGEERLRPLRELEEKRSSVRTENRLRNVRQLFDKDQSFRIVDHDRRWLCPFCAKVQEIRLQSESPGEEFVRAAAAHLESCKAHSVLGGRPRPMDELRSYVTANTHARQVDKIRHKVGKYSIWRVRDLTEVWYCPYCASHTGIHYPRRQSEDASQPDEFYRQILEHLGLCEDYRRPKARLKTREEVVEAVQAANVGISRRRRLRRSLLQSPEFGITDEFSNWACPYCRRVQKQIHIYAVHESAVFEKTIEQVVEHLYHNCDSFQEGRGATATLAELEAVVAQSARLSPGMLERDSGVRRTGSTSLEEEQTWQRIRDDVLAMKSRVERAQRQDSSLREARSKQQRLLPDIPELPGYDFARVYKPCDAVGGDFYAFFPTNLGHQALAIGDITGHGIEAALLMGLAKKLLEVHGRDRTSPAQTLCLANRDIYSDLDERTFVTVFYALLDPERLHLTFSRAGHDPLILFNPRRQPALQILDSKGMALGMDVGPIFDKNLEELEVALHPGDLVLQYTDGLTETMNEDNEQFGHERLHAVIREFGHFEAEYVLWKIEKAADAFRGSRGRSDDMTMVAFKVLE